MICTMNLRGTSNERRRVEFRGRVQGVGFRYQTHQIASRYSVSGFVQNKPDGSVLLVVAGEPAVLDELIAEIRSTMARYIESVAVSEELSCEEFEDFSIRY